MVFLWFFYMFAFFAFSIAPLVIIWLIWRKRFKRLTEQVTYLAARIQDLEQQISLSQAAPPPPKPHVEHAPQPEVAPSVAQVKGAEAWGQLIAERPPIPRIEPARAVAEATPAKAAPPRTPPMPRPTPPAAKLRERISPNLAKMGVDAADWEAVIGGKWLNKIGIVVFVIGVALFLGYSLRYMGPLGRVATGVVTSLTLLFGGVLLERVEKYSLFAKPLIGGGWALLYFTGYAAHNIEVSKIIHDPIRGIALLAVIAGGMILHSLKYRSQVVTGIAYFLGFLTVAISPLTGFALVASAILAASLVAILRGTGSSALGLFGVAATYLNHLLWLEYRMGGPAQLVHTDSFWLAQGMLVLYWLLFSAFDFVLEPGNDTEEKIGFAASLANTVAFLGLSYRQVGIVFPDARYLLTGLTALAYVASSYLLRVLGRHKYHLINASVAVLLIALTFPLKPPSSPLSQHWLAIAWLLEAAVVLALGSYLKEMVFRMQAYLLSAVALGALFVINLYGTPEPPDVLRWATVLPAIAFFYLLLWWLPKSLATGKVLKDEKYVGPMFSYSGSALLAILLWKELDPVAVALAWGFMGLILLEAGVRFGQVPLRIQAYLLSALAFGRLFLANFTAPGEILGLSHRVVTVVPIIAIFYYLVHRLKEEGDAGRLAEYEKHLPQVYSYTAAALLVILARFELTRSLTVLAWAALGFILLTLGIILRNRDLRIQGCLIAILTVWRSWSTNFFLVGSLYGIPERLATTVPVIALLFISQLLCLYRRELFPKAKEAQRGLARLDAHAQGIFSILGGFLLAILLFFEVRGNLLTVAWTIEGLGLMAAGFLLRERTLRLSGLGLFAVCLFKVFVIDLRGLETIYRILSFILLGIILLLVSFAYTKYKDLIKRYI